MRVQQKIAINIRKFRVGRGLTQEALAIDARVDRSYMSRLERGLENPTVAVLARVAVALKISEALLFQSPRSGETVRAPLRPGRKPKR